MSYGYGCQSLQRERAAFDQPAQIKAAQAHCERLALRKQERDLSYAQAEGSRCAPVRDGEGMWSRAHPMRRFRGTLEDDEGVILFLHFVTCTLLGSPQDP